jgi:hypothetical protein
MCEILQHYYYLALCQQLANAYDVLHRYETGTDEGDIAVAHVTPSSWGLEAVGWTSKYEKITKKLIDDDVLMCPTDPMKFYAFAGACVAPKKWMEASFNSEAGGYNIYLSDSSRTRSEILARVFKPLLGDIFSFNVVNQIFESLGIKSDYEYLLKVSSPVDAFPPNVILEPI